jgi:hypothetical protein
MRRTKATHIYRKTGNLRAVQFLLGREGTVRYLGMDYPAPAVRKTANGSELTTMRWGMPRPPKFGGPAVTNIRNTASPH